MVYVHVHVVGDGMIAWSGKSQIGVQEEEEEEKKKGEIRESEGRE